MKITFSQEEYGLWRELQLRAYQEGLDVPSLVKKELQKVLGLSLPSRNERVFPGKLASAWTTEEALEFERNTEPFNRIDEDLWKS